MMKQIIFKVPEPVILLEDVEKTSIIIMKQDARGKAIGTIVYDGVDWNAVVIGTNVWTGKTLYEVIERVSTDVVSDVFDLTFHVLN